MTSLDADLRRRGRLGPWMAAIWLLFLVEPLRESWRHLDTWRGPVGILLTVAFSVVYLTLWIRLRADRFERMMIGPNWAVAGVWFVVLAGLGIADVAVVGEHGMACAVYVAVSTVMLFPLRWAAPIVALIAGGSVALGALVPGWESMVGLAFSITAASLAVFGIREVWRRNIQLVQAHEANAALAVTNERNRFARDLHDILGHSLTVITVKAELARRMIDVDPERTRDELADLERLSREALADVRRAVEGYRELSLAGELSRARLALTAAGIEATVPDPTPEVPEDLRDLFAWVLREGVTNVLRHSGAETCTITLTASSVEICDDGRSVGGLSPGNGLRGLRERAAAMGARLEAGPGERGFRLAVLT
jgi:two-component system sensor histidine kinase DesK